MSITDAMALVDDSASNAKERRRRREASSDIDEGVEDEDLRDILGELRRDVEEAIDLFQTDFEEDRERAQRYFKGESDLQVTAENRSHYVATKVRDAIRNLKPDLMRILMGEDVVEFLPMSPEIAPLAVQQSKYCAQLFKRKGGYQLLYSVCHTALLHKLGPAKVYIDVVKEPTYDRYSNISEGQLRLLQEDQDAEIFIDAERPAVVPDPMTGVTQQGTVYDVEVTTFKERRKLCMQAIPVEDFFVDEWADNLEKDFRLIGHQRDISVSDGVAMGFDEEDIEDLDSRDPEMYDNVGLSYARRGYYLRDTQDSHRTPNKRFLLTEVYYWADLDDIGVVQLYRFWLGGTAYRYLAHERVEDHPFVGFAVDPEPFTVFGTSMYDITHSDQDVQTSLTRAVIDNAHQSNNPRLGIHDTMVSMADVLNTEIGAPIRMRGQGQIQVIQVPFTGGQLMPLLQYMDQKTDDKTGISRASTGLDPKALQSTDKEAVMNTIAKQAGQAELIGRNLAETGLKPLFRKLLKLTLDNPDPMRTMQLAGEYIPAPLHAFDPDLDMDVNIGPGAAKREEKIAALEQVALRQEKVLAEFGPDNGVVSLRQIFNTVEDSLALMGLRNPRRYFNAVTSEVEQQLMQRIAAAKSQEGQGGQDPAGMVAAAQVETQGKIAIEQARGSQQMQIEAARDQRERQRDQMKFASDSANLRVKTQMDDRHHHEDLAFQREEMMNQLFAKLADIEARLDAQLETAQIQAKTQQVVAKNRPRPTSNS